MTVKFVSSSHQPRSRLTRMRLRDNDRWVCTYRDRAWEAALEEARHRSFLSNLIYAVTMWTKTAHRSLED